MKQIKIWGVVKRRGDIWGLVAGEPPNPNEVRHEAAQNQCSLVCARVEAHE